MFIVQSMFFLGLRFFISSFWLTLNEPKLFTWCKHTLLKSFVLSLVILLTVIGLGLKLILSLGHTLEYSLLSLLWVVLALYFSGAFTLALMGILNGLTANEDRLLEALIGKKLNAPLRTTVRQRWQELQASVVTVVCAVFFLCCFFLPPLIPFGVALLAWAMGREALNLGHRLSSQVPNIEISNTQSPLQSNRPSALFAVGLGLVPVLFSIVPLFAVLFWPVLTVAAVRASRSSASLKI